MEVDGGDLAFLVHALLQGRTGGRFGALKRVSDLVSLLKNRRVRRQTLRSYK